MYPLRAGICEPANPRMYHSGLSVAGVGDPQDASAAA